MVKKIRKRIMLLGLVCCLSSPAFALPQPAAPVILIDPGHQGVQDHRRERRSPESDQTNYRCASGTYSRKSGLEEHQLTLEIAQQVKQALEAEGFVVHLTRQSPHVNISNRERALLATELGAVLWISLHADGSDSSKDSGFSVLYSSPNNLSNRFLQAENRWLAEELSAQMKEKTGVSCAGLYARSDLALLNWAQVPGVLLETGFLTNRADEKRLTDPLEQKKIGQAITGMAHAYLQMRREKEQQILEQAVRTIQPARSSYSGSKMAVLG